MFQSEKIRHTNFNAKKNRHDRSKLKKKIKEIKRRAEVFIIEFFLPFAWPDGSVSLL